MAESGRSAKAYTRAMSIARLLAGGMGRGDAVELHARTLAGGAWEDTAERLGVLNLGSARRALDREDRVCARRWLLRASACFRFAHTPLPDADQRKTALYVRMRDTFRRAGDLTAPAVERIRVPWRDGSLTGWLIRAALPGPQPFVIGLGGVDAWCEEYERSSRYLSGRGVTTLLTDAPGQGGSRLLEGLHLDAQVVDALRAVVDFAIADRHCNGRVGLWGNSAGGWLAARLAAADDRISACAINGGTDRPTEILDRYPRFVSQFQLMTGSPEPAQARRILDELAIDDGTLARLSCPLHVVHGTADRVFLVDGARRIHAGAGGADKTLTEFADGDHCVTNRSHEMHALLADWLADRLHAAGAGIRWTCKTPRDGQSAAPLRSDRRGAAALARTVG